MTQEEKAKAYDEALALMKDCIPDKDGYVCVRPCDIFPELAESEDERIRKWLIGYFHQYKNDGMEQYANGLKVDDIIAWLEKQGNTNKTIDRDEFVQGVLRGAAINLITWIDYNAAEGNMCLSNMECKDIENALVSGDWNKIYAYIKKKLEKQAPKPKWSEEDEKNVNSIIFHLKESLQYNEERYVELCDWLNSLKQRLEEQQ